MSAIGPKRTFPLALHMSAFGGKADIARESARVEKEAEGRLNRESYVMNILWLSQFICEPATKRVH